MQKTPQCSGNCPENLSGPICLVSKTEVDNKFSNHKTNHFGGIERVTESTFRYVVVTLNGSTDPNGEVVNLCENLLLDENDPQQFTFQLDLRSMRQRGCNCGPVGVFPSNGSTVPEEIKSISVRIRDETAETVITADTFYVIGTGVHMYKMDYKLDDQEQEAQLERDFHIVDAANDAVPPIVWFKHLMPTVIAKRKLFLCKSSSAPKANSSSSSSSATRGSPSAGASNPAETNPENKVKAKKAKVTA